MKILIGMSGGVDSTYAASALLAQGHEVEGAVLRMHEYTELSEARAAADFLGIKLHIIDASEAFSSCVEPNFISEYAKGRTPNPCIVCNSDVKFRILADFARENGFDKIATGHYASITTVKDGSGERYALRRPSDAKKDQTYMLWRLPQNVLSMLVFPLADVLKQELRGEALSMGMVAADRPDSQEICFIPDNDYPAYIEARIGNAVPGNFVDDEGRVLGEHRGIIHYTVGQRKGLGISLGKRAFVTAINPEDNTVTLSPSPRSTTTFTVSGIVASGVKYEVGQSLDLEVKVRYQAPLVKCRATFLDGARAKVELATPALSLTAGQSAVFYTSDTVAFGAFID